MLFERLIVHRERKPRSVAMNMAIDEALLEHVAVPTLRLYEWRQPSLSFGYFGKFADVAAEGRMREIVRRWTGGGIVLHGCDLTYAVVTPAGYSASTKGPAAIYAALHTAIREALGAEGRDAELAAAGAPKISDACFANPVRDDVMLLGRKIAGAAQRRTRRGFLHQGSIQLPDLSEAFRDRFARALSPRVESREISPEALRRAEVLAAEKYATEDWLRRW
jgi:lipoyl(octanoyl) transferase